MDLLVGLQRGPDPRLPGRVLRGDTSLRLSASNGRAELYLKQGDTLATTSAQGSSAHIQLSAREEDGDGSALVDLHALDSHASASFLRGGGDVIQTSVNLGTVDGGGLHRGGDRSADAHWPAKTPTMTR